MTTKDEANSALCAMYDEAQAIIDNVMSKLSPEDLDTLDKARSILGTISYVRGCVLDEDRDLLSDYGNAAVLDL